MMLYHTLDGPIVERDGRMYALQGVSWDALVNRDDLAAVLSGAAAQSKPPADPAAAMRRLLAPIGSQEVWAAGVTYYRSRTARMEESEAGGGSDFYDKVYHAERPELFLKATAHRVVGHGQVMHLRRDATWMVPEPELTLAITRSGRIIGYAIGNDLSSRDIEGQNPLYLPQAKTFKRCAAVGPGLLVRDEPLPPTTGIELVIRRGGAEAFRGRTELSQMKQTLANLVEHLFRDNSFPNGCLLMTGTGVVPPNDFSLRAGDEVTITIDGIGSLVNAME